MFYVGDDIRVILTVDEPLTGSTVLVQYKKPRSSTIITVPGDEITIDLVTNRVTWDLPALINTAAGTWEFWVKVTNADALVATSSELLVVIEKH